MFFPEAGPITRRTGHRQRVLPEIPGYIPVYIQDGDEPPDVALLYQQARAAAHHDINNNADEIMAAEDNPLPPVEEQTRPPSPPTSSEAVPSKVGEPVTEKDADIGTPSVQIVRQ